MSGDRAATTETLTNFLLARIAEDERAYGVIVAEMSTARPVVPYLDLARRILAEGEARREIVKLHTATDWGMAAGMLCDHCSDQRWPCPTLRALALPYTDHPDYRDEWKP